MDFAVVFCIFTSKFAQNLHVNINFPQCAPNISDIYRIVYRYMYIYCALLRHMPHFSITLQPTKIPLICCIRVVQISIGRRRVRFQYRWNGYLMTAYWSTDEIYNIYLLLRFIVPIQLDVLKDTRKPLFRESLYKDCTFMFLLHYHS